MVTLEKYKGLGSRHTCPACGAKKKFVRYVDEAGRYLADQVGRCNRESNCGYHFKPKDYFTENPAFQNVSKMSVFPGLLRQGSKRENCSQAIYEAHTQIKRPDTIDKRHLIESLDNYDQNAFVHFLLGLFPFDAGDVWQAVSEYLIGTGRNGEAIFWQIDAKKRIRTGKLIAYDPATGKRRKDRSPNWIHSTLKKAGQLPEAFELQQCFFGEHLLSKYPGRPIAFVESEKSAVIGSLCKRVFPDLVWIACGGKSNFKVESLARLGRDRTILIFPDADGFEKWQAIASDASKSGLRVKVSDLIETSATDAEKAKGYDLADYLIARQLRRNDPELRKQFAEMIGERLAIMTIDGGLSEAEAERQLEASGYVEHAERCVLE
ncbi:MAG: DUF6371 domain-containing protein [Pyrinomonadaceae bacterium]